VTDDVMLDQAAGVGFELEERLCAGQFVWTRHSRSGAGSADTW